jgi:uncharacterized protein (TIGR00297 family)
MIERLAFGFGLSLLIGSYAYQRQHLTQSGLISAVMVGSLILGLGHWMFYVFLMGFFFSSLLIRKVVEIVFPNLPQTFDHPQKHEARTGVQVLANAGILTVISAFYALAPSVELIVLAGLSMAASTADTWASEIGALSPQPPTLILSKRPIRLRLSGGVTPLGLWASLAGSAWITLLVGAVLVMNGQMTPLLGVACGLCWVGGFLGSIIDSVLGELVQAKYITQTHEVVETVSSSSDQLIQGIRWIDNNLVNFISNALVVGAYVLISQLIF